MKVNVFIQYKNHKHTCLYDHYALITVWSLYEEKNHSMGVTRLRLLQQRTENQVKVDSRFPHWRFAIEISGSMRTLDLRTLNKGKRLIWLFSRRMGVGNTIEFFPSIPM